ncbi:MAG: phospholipase A [Verrucomicrobiales bacterium]|nr:phospholipase A [Verrucomicrobiales bacterium]
MCLNDLRRCLRGLVVGWAILLFGGATALGVRGADVAPTLVVQVEPRLEAGPDGWVMNATAFFLNPSLSPLTFQPPPTLQWLFVEGATSGGGFLDPVTTEDRLKEVTLQPGGFLRQRYRGRIPLLGLREALVIFPGEGGAEHRVSVPDTVNSAPEKGTAPVAPGTRESVVDANPVGPRELPGQSFFRRHFAGYEPMYFVWGPESPNLKFQVSLRYKIINPDADLGRWWRWGHGMHFAYTQTSLWDFDRPSSPFYDSSYKPEVMWRHDDLFPGAVTWWHQLGMQVGLQHESNGKDGEDSRGLNILYFKPTFLFGQATNLFLSVSPRAWAYLGEMPDNRDISDYRGHVDLAIKAGWATSLQMAGYFRVGDDFNRGSMQVDVSYPLGELLNNIDVFLHAQYFNGWGESLLDYDQRTWMFRIGLSIFR